MKRLALQVEHKFKNRVVGVHLLDSDMATLGSSRTADIRLLGEDIAGLHAAFEAHGETWVLSDLGSTSGTWVNQKPIVEQKIDGATVIHIGHHQLKATPHVLERHLFDKDLSQGQGQHTYHQVVVMRRGLVQEALLLNATESYVSEVPGVGTLPAATGPEWKTTEVGIWTIRQRLAKSDELKVNTKDVLGEDWKRPGPMIAALFLLFIVIGLAVLMPHGPNDEMKTVTPENQYTRMIFDGQKMRKQKAVAEKARKHIQGQSQQGVAKDSPGGDSGAKVAGGSKATPGAKVVMNLKNAGLGALIGKVAARAAKTAVMVQTAGVAADSATSGRALSLGGGSSLDKLGGGGGGGNGSTTLKVGGLGTAGKGGGGTGHKGSGALSLGNIGNAEVGVLEEEGEVDGGLDKEAIARVIRSQLGQIRYCYERQLSASPDLYGKILIKFTIGAAGSVVAQAVGTTSLNNAMVEGCILRRVAGWQFPTPKGGTNVLVTYPFLFKSTK
jgi:hypothetical protein